MKTPFELIDPYFEEGIANVLAFGLQKYPDDPWKRYDKNKFFAAARRHLNAIQKAMVEDNSLLLIDEESGLFHIDHAATNCMLLRWHLLNELDCWNRKDPK